MSVGMCTTGISRRSDDAICPHRIRRITLRGQYEFTWRICITVTRVSIMTRHKQQAV